MTHLLQRLRWSAAPPDATPIQRQNFINVQIDGVAIGVTAAAAPFLPVFLARLGASNFQVGLLTAMPALAGLLLAVPVGRFLERRRRIVPWYGGARFAYVMAYAVTGLIPFVVPPQYLVPAILVVWAAATLPQTTLNIAFSVVMNAVAGSKGRYELMSRRWSVLGFTTAVTVAVVGQVLERLRFPLNYQFVFAGLSLAVLLSLYFSSRLQLPERDPAPPAPNRSWAVRLRDFARRIRAQPAFVGFTAKRFVFLAGVALAAPIFPLYYVREARLGAMDRLHRHGADRDFAGGLPVVGALLAHARLAVRAVVGHGRAGAAPGPHRAHAARRDHRGAGRAGRNLSGGDGPGLL